MLRLWSRIAASLCLCSSLGCQKKETLGAPEVPEEVRDRDAGPATDPAPPRQAADEPTAATIDLSPHGLAATIEGDGRVEASATEDGVRLQYGDDFDLTVSHGALDMTGEREELVRAYGPRFERFLIDSEDVVAWELSTATGSSYHFFASFEQDALTYHCRSGADGAPSAQVVEAMIEMCRSVRAGEA